MHLKLIDIYGTRTVNMADNELMKIWIMTNLAFLKVLTLSSITDKLSKQLNLIDIYGTRTDNMADNNLFSS